MVAVLSNVGKPMMPTTEYKARKLIEKGRAIPYQYKPMFTIMILDRSGGYTQPIELKEDTGYEHIGISVCSQKHEYERKEIITLLDEPEKHHDARMYRRTRRNRLGYRPPRFDNRKKENGWIPPSLQHKIDIHLYWFNQYAEVLPITDAVFEIGTFDTQRLNAIEKGEKLPYGEDYQKGEQADFYTLRDAVFARDDYTCVVCGKGIQDGAVLRTHHVGYRHGDRSNRMSNLVTVCDHCHTTKNHQEGGALYNLKSPTKKKANAAFMNVARQRIIDCAKKSHPKINISCAFGSETKMSRKNLQIEKSHTNDAYAMGEFHPKHRCNEKIFQKVRRNNRILSRFYDAKYIDRRDGLTKTGKQLSSGRTNRNHKLDSENFRVYRGKKIQKGRTATRQQVYEFKTKDIVLYQGKRYVVKGTNNKGQNVQLYLNLTADLKDLTIKTKNKRKTADPNRIEVCDKVFTEFNGKKKVFTVKNIDPTTNQVSLQADLSTKPSELKLVKYSNGYKQIK